MRQRADPSAARRLPDWCDAFLDDAAQGDVLPPASGSTPRWPTPSRPRRRPCWAPAAKGPSFCPLCEGQRGLTSLTTPYSLAWRPLAAPDADAPALRTAGTGLARLLRGRAPTVLEALDPDAPGLDALLSGLRRAGFATLRYDHFGNWHEALPAGTSWDSYMAARPPALRTTIRRKLARCAREMAFERITAPGRRWRPASPPTRPCAPPAGSRRNPFPPSTAC